MSDPQTSARPHVIRDAKGKRPQFYDAPGLDQAMSMVMVLANEISVLHDRLDSIERVAAVQGIELAAGIEALVLDQGALESREVWRQDFLSRLFYMLRKQAGEAAAAETEATYKAAIAEIAIS